MQKKKRIKGSVAKKRPSLLSTLHLPTIPTWLSELVDFDVHQAKVKNQRKVLVRAEGRGDDGEQRSVLEFSEIDGELRCFRVTRDGYGRPMRVPHSAFSQLPVARQRQIVEFVTRVHWLRTEATWEQNVADEGTRRQLRAMTALGRLRRLEDVPKFAAELDLDERFSTAAANANGVRSSAGPGAPPDLRLWLDILLGRWERVFGESEGIIPGSWADVVRSGVCGDVRRLQELASFPEDRQEVGPIANVRARVLGLVGFHEQSIDIYERGASEQHNADVCIEIARYLVEIGRTKQAIPWLKRALLLPDGHPGMPQRACRELIFAGAFDEACLVLESLCNRQGAAWVNDSDSVTLAKMLTDLYLWAARTGDAEKMLRRLEVVDGADAGEEHAFWMVRSRGILLALKERWDEALNTLLEADEIKPGDAEVNGWLAEIFLRREEMDAARERLNRSRSRHDEAYHVLLGAALHKLREPPPPEVLIYLDTLGKSASSILKKPRERRQVILDALPRFGGQRSQPATMLRPATDDSLGLALVGSPPMEEAASARMASGALLKRIGTIPVEELQNRFDELAQSYPKSPHPLCYKGELLLWLGDFDGSLSCFDQALSRDLARWAYVGRAAVHMLRGENRLANASIRECHRLFRPIPGATTHVYQGESARRRGRWNEAINHLQIAVETKPGRAAAWINLALTYYAMGQADKAEPIVRSLEQQFPRLFWDSYQALSGGTKWPMPRGRVREILEKSLELMRGNRSSHLMTYFDSEGTFRLFHTATNWSDQAVRLSHFVSIDLASRIVRGNDH